MPACLLYEAPHTRKESSYESGRRGLYTLAELIEIAEHRNKLQCVVEMTLRILPL